MKSLIICLSFLFLSILSFSQNDIDLRLNLKKGDHFLFEKMSLSQTNQNIMGNQQSITKEDNITIMLVISEIHSDKTYSTNFIYKRIKSKIETEDLVECFDTDSIENENSSYKEIYYSLIDNPVQIKINDKGEILSVDNLNSLFSSKSFIAADENAKMQIQNQFGEEGILKLLSGFNFSNKKNQDHTIRTKTDSLISGIYYYTNIQNTLYNNSDHTYVIKKQSDIYTNPNKSLYLNGFYINYDLKGTQNTVNVFFNDNCMLKESTVKELISGTAGMKYSEDSDNAYSWPIQIENTISIKVSKIGNNEK